MSVSTFLITVCGITVSLASFAGVGAIALAVGALIPEEGEFAAWALRASWLLSFLSGDLAGGDKLETFAFACFAVAPEGDGGGGRLFPSALIA